MAIFKPEATQKKEAIAYQKMVGEIVKSILEMCAEKDLSLWDVTQVAKILDLEINNRVQKRKLKDFID